MRQKRQTTQNRTDNSIWCWWYFSSTLVAPIYHITSNHILVQGLCRLYDRHLTFFENAKVLQSTILAKDLWCEMVARLNIMDWNTTQHLNKQTEWQMLAHSNIPSLAEAAAFYSDMSCPAWVNFFTCSSNSEPNAGSKGGQAWKSAFVLENWINNPGSPWNYGPPIMLCFTSIVDGCTSPPNSCRPWTKIMAVVMYKSRSSYKNEN